MAEDRAEVFSSALAAHRRRLRVDFHVFAFTRVMSFKSSGLSRSEEDKEAKKAAVHDKRCILEASAQRFRNCEARGEIRATTNPA